MQPRASQSGPATPWIALALRAAIAIPLLVHGAGRLGGTGPGGAVGAFVARQLRFLDPDAAAWLALAAGALLLVGLAMRPAAIVLCLVVVMSRMRPIWQFGVSDVLFVLLAWLIATGAGRVSLDGLIASRVRRHRDVAAR